MAVQVDKPTVIGSEVSLWRHCKGGGYKSSHPSLVQAGLALFSVSALALCITLFCLLCTVLYPSTCKKLCQVFPVSCLSE
ncbi:hypothetical protein E2C01_035894 [Portunus trituberculatus]|uniref:Uncharacterized protein n=1 Tax=Portunus trituberculatus TaxID=210409 RepID=A0A5B7F9L3_PORTR|nr:hypothetical protein [Portunus trituberculatus]